MSLFYNTQIKFALWALLALAGAAAFTLAESNPHHFSTWFAVEDGPIEYATAILLFCASLVLLGLARQVTGLRFWLLVLYALAFFFAAGEEVSWGQRIFGIESSEFFQANNYQGETNLHNLVVGDVHLVEHIFGRGLTVVLLLYLVVLPLLYPVARWVRALCDVLAVPVPPLYVAAIALAASFGVASLDASRNWEVYEFVFSLLACLIFLAPVNRATFNR